MDPRTQNLVGRTVNSVSKICLKVCYKDTEPSSECLNNCVSSYSQATNIVVETLKELS